MSETKRYKDVLGRRWTGVRDDTRLMGDGWNSRGYWSRDTIELLTGGPLVEIEPETVVWEVAHGFTQMRVGVTGVVEYRFRLESEEGWSPWLTYADTRTRRLAAALLQGREPDPSVARRVTEPDAPGT